MFLSCLLKREKPWINWLFLWAAFVSYTRIYLGVHYPGDIIVGALIGVLFGWLVFKLYIAHTNIGGEATSFCTVSRFKNILVLSPSEDVSQDISQIPKSPF